jgi:hypothetical protein
MFAATLQVYLNDIKVRSDKLIKRACDPYRPELHYMRGPGPMWHAKHQARPQEVL